MIAHISLFDIALSTTISFCLLGLSRYVKKVEEIVFQNRNFLNGSKRTFYLEVMLDRWLRHSYVAMTARQWLGSILVFTFLPIGFTLINHSLGYLPILASVYISISFIMYPFRKRKKTTQIIENEIRLMGQYIAKLYERHVPLNEMLYIIHDRLNPSIFKEKLHEALLRSESVDVFSDSILWLSEQFRLPSLKKIANLLLQSSRHANLPIDVRLVEMAEKEREKIIITFEEIAESNRVRALIEGGFFIALPIIALLTIVVFYYVFNNFQLINFHA